MTEGVLLNGSGGQQQQQAQVGLTEVRTGENTWRLCMAVGGQTLGVFDFMFTAPQVAEMAASALPGALKAIARKMNGGSSLLTAPAGAMSMLPPVKKG